MERNYNLYLSYQLIFQLLMKLLFMDNFLFRFLDCFVILGHVNDSVLTYL